MIALQLFRESYVLFPFATTIDVNERQKPNAPFAIDVTLLGIVIEVNEVQPKKASSPIDVTLLGMVIEVNPQLEKALLPIDVTPSSIVTCFI